MNAPSRMITSAEGLVEEVPAAAPQVLPNRDVQASAAPSTKDPQVLLFQQHLMRRELGNKAIR